MTSPAPGDRNQSRVNAAIRQLYAGGANNRGTVTLRANQTTTVVTHEGVNPNSHISIMPLTESALKAMIPTPKLLELTRNLSLAAGNVSYTGLGFKPTAIEFMAGINNGTAGWGSLGWVDSNGSIVSIEFNPNANTGVIYRPNNLAGIVRDALAGGNYQFFNVASMDADGFTLTWTVGGTPGATIAGVGALCFPETGVRVSSRTTGSFTLTHSSNPAVDQNFTFSTTGGSL